MSSDEKKKPGADLTATTDSDFLLYATDDGRIKVDVRLEDETVWLTQAGMAELYQTSTPNINIHLRNIFKEAELQKYSVIKEYLITAADGKKYKTKHYSLDAILAVGYRVRSTIGTRFRQWATARLSEYIVKGFTMDDERLKNPGGIVDHFDELLERIRDIRASEARVYQQIRDIFALAVDYKPDDRETQKFFATMQNKMHFAATGQTAAEIVHQRADAEKPNMNLTAWRGGRVTKADVTTAKNYLAADEIRTLNQITVMFLDQAQFRAERKQNVYMGEWEGFLDGFLTQNELPVLDGPGKVSHEKATRFAHEQYDTFSNRRRLMLEALNEGRYLEDLRETAKIVDATRKAAPKAKRAKPKKSGKGKP